VRACLRLKRYVACAHEPDERAGCVAVLETLDIMLRNPPAEARAARKPRWLALT
jgi:hypothetical protein